MSYAKLEGEQDGVIAQDMFVRTVMSYEYRLAELSTLLGKLEPVLRFDLNDRDMIECPVCKAEQLREDWWVASDDKKDTVEDFPHKDDCKWLRARALLAGGAKEGE